jgi:hypothetical protein
LALFNKKRNGKGKSSSKKGNNDGGPSHLGKKKYFSKIKCFSCHRNGNYASQCLEKNNKGKGNAQPTTSTKTQLDQLVEKFEKYFSLVFFLTTINFTRSAWYLDNGASHHMKKSQEIFSSLMERDSDFHVDLGDDAKYVVKGEGTIVFPT